MTKLLKSRVVRVVHPLTGQSREVDLVAECGLDIPEDAPESSPMAWLVMSDFRIIFDDPEA